MPSGSIDIANAALTMVGGKLITSLTSGDENAKTCNAIIDQVVDETISMATWQSTVRRATLNATTNTPVWHFDYEFQLPTDPLCLIVLEVDDANNVKGDLEWTVQGDKLLANDSSIQVRYIARESNYGLMGVLLKQAITFHLAWRIAYRVTSDNALANRLRNEFYAILQQAVMRDNLQGSNRDLSSQILTQDVR